VICPVFLGIHERKVVSFVGHELFVRAFFDLLALVEGVNLVCILDALQSVGDDHTSEF